MRATGANNLWGGCMLPRFFLVAGHQLGGRMLPAWPGGGRGSRPAPFDGQWVAWRIVGSNHRELARSPVVYPDAAAAQLAIASVQAGVERATGGTETVNGRWAWQLFIDGEPVAVSSRFYQRPRECVDSLATAVTAFKIGQLRDVRPGLRR